MDQPLRLEEELSELLVLILDLDELMTSLLSLAYCIKSNQGLIFNVLHHSCL